jgi:hypothetical protein
MWAHRGHAWLCLVTASGNTAGKRTNRGFEGLAISPDGRTAYAMLESAMLDEGAGNGSLARIVVLHAYKASPSDLPISCASGGLKPAKGASAAEAGVAAPLPAVEPSLLRALPSG